MTETDGSCSEPQSIEDRRLALDEKRVAGDLELRRAELELKRDELRARPLTNPLFLAVVASAVALCGNAIVAVLNGVKDRALDRTRAEAQLALQEAQANASLVLEAIRTGDTERAAANLEFFASAGLIPSTPELTSYLKNGKTGQGPALPGEPSTRRDLSSPTAVWCATPRTAVSGSDPPSRACSATSRG